MRSALLLLLAACSGKASDDTLPGGGGSGHADDTATPPVDLAIECQLVESDYGPAGSVDIDVEVFTDGLYIPWGIAWLPDGGMLLTERDGLLRRVGADGSLVEAPVATIDIGSSDEGGLLGIALSPDFDATRAFFLYVTASEGGVRNRVERWTLGEDGLSASLDRVLLDDIPAARFHNGGRLRIGPDGMLYVTTGDAREPDLSRDLSSTAGKVLRLTPDGDIPADNPDPTSPVWVSGLRNGQGIDWRDDGRMVLTDHGPSGDTSRFGHDEINVAEPGDDLGWPDVYACETEDGLRSPSMTWTDALPPGGHAIYRGTEIPDWQGDVLIGVMGFDGPDQPHLHRIRLSDDGNVTVSETYLRGEYGRLRDVIMGPDGGLYVTTSNCDGRGVCGDGDVILRIGRR
jgi:glucose/arabinose dehydrogenase